MYISACKSKTQELCSLTTTSLLFPCLDCYSLSVLRRANLSNQDCVKHYRISHLQNGWVYISPGLTFPSLHHLVEHYSGLYWGCNAVFLPDNSNRVILKYYLLSQSLQMDCAVGWQSPASSRVSATLGRPGRYPSLSGGQLSTGKTLAGVADSLWPCFYWWPPQDVTLLLVVEQSRAGAPGGVWLNKKTTDKSFLKLISVFVDTESEMCWLNSTVMCDSMLSKLSEKITHIIPTDMPTAKTVFVLCLPGLIV